MDAISQMQQNDFPHNFDVAYPLEIGQKVSIFQLYHNGHLFLSKFKGGVSSGFQMNCWMDKTISNKLYVQKEFWKIITKSLYSKY